MKICIITDEISADPETAIELGVGWGISDFELRGFFTDRIPHFSEYQKQRLLDALEQYQARIVAIGPGLFKIPFPQKQAPSFPLGWLDVTLYESWVEIQQLVNYHLNELLPASLDYANELGANLVVIFGFDRIGAAPGKPPDEVLNCLRLAAERASAAGIQLAIENEDGYWADTGGRSAQIVKLINHKALGLNWDPGNAFFAGDNPYPTGYSEVRGLVHHVHFKDACRNKNGEYAYTAGGDIDWEGQISALTADGYNGFISIETHIRPKVAAASGALDRLRALTSNAKKD